MAAQNVALLASLATILLPSLKKDGSGKSGEGGGSSSRADDKGESHFATFYVGIATGIGLSAVVMTQIQRRRIKERIRNYYLNEFVAPGVNSANNDTETHTEGSTLGESSLMQVIADERSSFTSMHCSKITLKSGTRTVLRESEGVEVYYVLFGVGDFISGDSDLCKLKANEHVVVNPWTSLSMTNDSRDDLVFLRISDEENVDNTAITVEKVPGKSTLKKLAKGFKTSISKLRTSSKDEGDNIASSEKE